MAIIGDIDLREHGWRNSFLEYMKADKGIPNKLLYIEPEEGWQMFDLQVMQWFLRDDAWGKR